MTTIQEVRVSVHGDRACHNAWGVADGAASPVANVAELDVHGDVLVAAALVLVPDLRSRCVNGVSVVDGVSVASGHQRDALRRCVEGVNPSNAATATPVPIQKYAMRASSSPVPSDSCTFMSSSEITAMLICQPHARLNMSLELSQYGPILDGVGGGSGEDDKSSGERGAGWLMM